MDAAQISVSSGSARPGATAGRLRDGPESLWIRGWDYPGAAEIGPRFLFLSFIYFIKRNKSEILLE